MLTLLRLRGSMPQLSPVQLEESNVTGKSSSNRPIAQVGAHLNISPSALCWQVESSQEKWGQKPSNGLCRFFGLFYWKNGARTVEQLDKDGETPAPSRTKRARERHPHRADNYSELRTWVRRAIVEAEKNNDSDKKDQAPNHSGKALKLTKKGSFKQEQQKESVEKP